MKKVSVVMCTYNGEKYLREQLDSILNQTYPLEEIVIQDDCSTDSTIDIIKEYQKKYPLIKYSVNEKNRGVNDNFFSVMNKATEEYIAISDQDDIWELDKIEKQINAIGNHLLCFGNSRFFRDDKTVKMDNGIPNYSIVRLVFLNVISGHVMLINSRILQLIPPQKDLILYDYLIALTAACHNSIIYCNNILCNHRIHDSNLTFGDKDIPKGIIKKTPSRAINVIITSLKIRKRLKPKAKKFFSIRYELISQTGVYTTETKAAKKIARLMADISFISTVRAMIFCLFNRNKIFDEKSSKIFTLLKAPFFPFQCYHFLNF